MPGFARAYCHGDGTPILSGASGTKAAAHAPLGVSQYRLSRLICRRPTSAASGNREPACRACRALHSGTGSTRTRWPGPRLRRPVEWRVGRCGAQSEYIKVRSVVGTGDEVAYRVLVGDLAEPTTAEPACAGFADVSQCGLRPPDDSTAVSVVSMRGGMAAQAVGDGQQPAARMRRIFSARGFPTSWPGRSGPGRSLHPPSGRTPAWLSAAGQIRKTCGVPAYRRVVIEKHRTQASRMMNAETAQAVTDSVH